MQRAAPTAWTCANVPILRSVFSFSNRSGARAAAVCPTGKRARPLWLVVLIGVATNPIIFMTVYVTFWRVSRWCGGAELRLSFCARICPHGARVFPLDSRHTEKRFPFGVIEC